MTFKSVLICFILCFFSAPKELFAQNTAVDTLPGANESLEQTNSRTYNPNKAALFSAIVPGSGQFYNRSYWKIPIVWGGLVTFGALVVYNNNQANTFQQELDYRKDNSGLKSNPDLTRFNEGQLERGRDQSIRYRDLNIILGVLWYGLNIMDAYVDAHLKEFEVSDNLAIGINPEIYSNGSIMQPGMSIGLKIRP